MPTAPLSRKSRTRLLAVLGGILVIGAAAFGLWMLMHQPVAVHLAQHDDQQPALSLEYASAPTYDAASRTISAQLTVSNASESAVSEVRLMPLLSEDILGQANAAGVAGVSSQDMAHGNYTDSFSVADQASASETVTLQVPAAIPSGTYHLTVTAVDRSGQPLGSRSFSLASPLSGSNAYLTQDQSGTAIYTHDGTAALSGAVQPSSLPQARMAVSNPTDTAITATPVIQVYAQASFAGKPIVSQTLSPVTVVAHGSTTVTAPVSGVTAGGAYVARLSLTDASGALVALDTRYNFSIAGERASLTNQLVGSQSRLITPSWITDTVVVSPSADGATAFLANLVTTVYQGDRKLGSTVTPIAIDPTSSLSYPINVPYLSLGGAPDSVRVVTQLEKADGTVLDTLSLEGQPSAAVLGPEGTLLLIILVIILVLLAVFLYRRTGRKFSYRDPLAVAVIIIMVMAGLTPPDSALADNCRGNDSCTRHTNHLSYEDPSVSGYDGLAYIQPDLDQWEQSVTGISRNSSFLSVPSAGGSATGTPVGSNGQVVKSGNDSIVYYSYSVQPGWGRPQQTNVNCRYVAKTGYKGMPSFQWVCDPPTAALDVTQPYSNFQIPGNLTFNGKNYSQYMNGNPVFTRDYDYPLFTATGDTPVNSWEDTPQQLKTIAPMVQVQGDLGSCNNNRAFDAAGGYWGFSKNIQPNYSTSVGGVNYPVNSNSITTSFNFGQYMVNSQYDARGGYVVQVVACLAAPTATKFASKVRIGFSTANAHYWYSGNSNGHESDARVYYQNVLPTVFNRPDMKYTWPPATQIWDVEHPCEPFAACNGVYVNDGTYYGVPFPPPVEMDAHESDLNSTISPAGYWFTKVSGYDQIDSDHTNGSWHYWYSAQSSQACDVFSLYSDQVPSSQYSDDNPGSHITSQGTGLNFATLTTSTPKSQVVAQSALYGTAYNKACTSSFTYPSGPVHDLQGSGSFVDDSGNPVTTAAIGVKQQVSVTLTDGPVSGPITYQLVCDTGVAAQTETFDPGTATYPLQHTLKNGCTYSTAKTVTGAKVTVQRSGKNLTVSLGNLTVTEPSITGSIQFLDADGTPITEITAGNPASVQVSLTGGPNHGIVSYALTCDTGASAQNDSYNPTGTAFPVVRTLVPTCTYTKAETAAVSVLVTRAGTTSTLTASLPVKDADTLAGSATFVDGDGKPITTVAAGTAVQVSVNLTGGPASGPISYALTCSAGGSTKTENYTPSTSGYPVSHVLAPTCTYSSGGSVAASVTVTRGGQNVTFPLTLSVTGGGVTPPTISTRFCNGE